MEPEYENLTDKEREAQIFEEALFAVFCCFSAALLLLLLRFAVFVGVLGAFSCARFAREMHPHVGPDRKERALRNDAFCCFCCCFRLLFGMILQICAVVCCLLLFFLAFQLTVCCLCCVL